MFFLPTSFPVYRNDGDIMEWLIVVTLVCVICGVSFSLLEKRFAVGMVNPDHYQMTWFGSQSKCNCQDYASALRAKYRELENDPEIKCKCRRGK